MWEGNAAAIEDRSRDYRDLAGATGTSPGAILKPPALLAGATWTAKTLGPTQPLQIGNAGLLVGKPGAKLLPRAWIIKLFRDCRSENHNILRLLY